jgi:hypothetical protein
MQYLDIVTSRAELRDAQECDATGDDRSTEAGTIKSIQHLSITVKTFFKGNKSLGSFNALYFLKLIM